jgi:hypothetical protein
MYRKVLRLCFSGLYILEHSASIFRAETLKIEAAGSSETNLTDSLAS